MNALKRRCETIRRMATRQQGVYYPLTNGVTNGNYAAGTTGWTPTGGTGLVSNGVYEYTVGTAASSNRIETAAINIYAGKTYYVRCKITTPKTVTCNITLGSANSISIPANTETIISGIVIPGMDATTPFRVYVNANSQLSNGDKVYIKDCMYIDLTAVFGAGKEPNAAQVNAALVTDGTPYWNGTRNVLFNLVA